MVPSGATSQAVLCGKTLKEIGVDVTFCQTPPMNIRGKDYIESETEGVPVVYPVGTLMKTVRSFEPDVVLVQVYTDQLVAELPELVRSYPTAIRVGVNVLELLVTTNYPRKLPGVVSFLQSADHVIAASRNTRNVLEGLGVDADDISVIETAVNPSDFPISTCNDPTIGILGRIFPVKNHLTLLQAIKLVRKKFPDVELAITGEGRLANIYEELIKLLLLETHVKITGYMSDLKWFFREISIFALPSISENLPMCVLEAYASGIPCVLSESGWGDTFQACLKARPDDPAAWARQLLRLLTDRDFYMDVREKQLEELKNFSLQTIIPKYVACFKMLVKRAKYKVKRFNPM